MSLLRLAWQYLWARPLTAALNLLLMTIGLASIAFLLLAQARVERAFERDLAGIDAVVGAKGSPMQLILAGVFHLDVPPGNIALADAERLAQHPQVAQFIPLSLGDNLQGFRIVGTTSDYLALYGGRLARGTLWQAPLQAVLGAEVARRTVLDLGARFAGAHGLAAGGAVHDTTPYTVSGVLQPCACVLDRLVLTATESVWAVHDELHVGEGMSDAERAELDAAMAGEREITLGLVRYRSPLAAASFPRFVNGSTPMQAAAPAIEVTRLMSLVGQGTQLLQALAAVLLVVATLSVFIALWSAVRERRADLAMLRMLGAPPRRVAGLLLAEAGWLALLATGLGLLLALALAATAGLWWADALVLLPAGVWPVTLAWVPVLAATIALLASSLPAITAYRTEVHTLLNHRS